MLVREFIYSITAIIPLSQSFVLELSFSQQFTPWYPTSLVEGFASSLTPLHFVDSHLFAWLHESTHCCSENALKPIRSAPPSLWDFSVQTYLSLLIVLMTPMGQVMLILVIDAGGT
jgi:hypothetical protein